MTKRKKTDIKNFTVVIYRTAHTSALLDFDMCFEPKNM